MGEGRDQIWVNSQHRVQLPQVCGLDSRSFDKTFLCYWTHATTSERESVEVYDFDSASDTDQELIGKSQYRGPGLRHGGGL